ncbi:MAG: hypothetical protein K6F09_05665 [Clostridiales bacterium]|nr:hypothetical protein [Clostridiales bacterium]
MSVSFNGFNESLLTFNAASGFTAEGVPVKMSADNTVNSCADGDDFCGISENVRNGYAAVSLSGAATLPYTGQAPVAGYACLVANGAGGVKTASSGISRLILSVDTVNSKVTFLV